MKGNELGKDEEKEEEEIDDFQLADTLVCFNKLRSHSTCLVSR